MMNRRLGGLEINHQLILGWGLNRQVSWHFTLKDTIDMAGRAVHQIDRHGAP